MSHPNTVEEVSQLQPTGQGPELFVTCASYEDRCVRSSEILGSFRPQQSVILWYDEPELSAIRTENKNTISANLSSQLGPHARVIEMPISLLDPLSASESIVQEIAVLVREHSHMSLTIDISVLTKQHLFLILRRLESMRPQIKEIRLLYSFVDSYGFLRGSSVSRGLERIGIVPSFGGLYHLDRKNLLVLFLGFEGPRASAVYERYDPSRTIVIIGKQSYKEGWDKLSEGRWNTIYSRFYTCQRMALTSFAKVNGTFRQPRTVQIAIRLSPDRPPCLFSTSS